MSRYQSRKQREEPRLQLLPLGFQPPNREARFKRGLSDPTVPFTCMTPDSKPGTAGQGLGPVLTCHLTKGILTFFRRSALARRPSATMGGAENGAASGEKEVKKQDSHTDHRDDFIASSGLTTAGGILLRGRSREGCIVPSASRFVSLAAGGFGLSMSVAAEPIRLPRSKAAPPPP